MALRKFGYRSGKVKCVAARLHGIHTKSMKRTGVIMAKNPLPTATAIEEMLQILSGGDYEKAMFLHEFGRNIGCKIEPRTGARYYRIQYSTPKPKRSLFTIECNESRWRVKANLYHISQYIELAASSSDAIKSAVKATRACTKCNSRCIGGSHFTLDGRDYITCIGSGHYFEDMDKADWERLAALLSKENDAIAVSD